MSRVLAFDFGASSGRAILAEYKDKKLSYSEVHRFENNPIEKNDHLYWDFENLMDNVYAGIKKAGSFDSVAFDTWGVDFGLLDKNGELIENPFHYRDSRTDGVVEKALEIMPANELYQQTGNQIMQINTLFQLLATDIEKAKTLLFMPDLFAFKLCGEKVCETSIASTSQMFSPLNKQFNQKVIDCFNLNKELFAPVVTSGTVIGNYKKSKVISVAGHDTQCAVAALPTNKTDVAFLSCGTWSLLGTELGQPILTQMSMNQNLSNEVGANGKINYLKNIIGLWLIQESKRALKKQGKDYSYADLEKMALESEPFRCFIDPDAPEFTPPGDIPARVQQFCRKTGQRVPQTTGEIIRCIYESLALKYRFAVEQLKEVSNKQFSQLHILGGGTKDSLLCQMTADSTGLPVIAGPVEATALGNIIIQLVALGEFESIDEGRKLIEKTEKLNYYEPFETTLWDNAYNTYKNILGLEK